jgi:hypothetical protein
LSASVDFSVLEQFRNYFGLNKIARCGFPWEKTTEWPVASVYTNCENCCNAKNAAQGGVHFAGSVPVYKVDSISKPHASSSASGIYFEFLLRRAHSRNRVERTY